MKKFVRLAAVLLVFVLMVFAQLGQYQGRLSGDDQKRFDESYRSWVAAKQTNNQDQAADAEKKMREIMGKYSIPESVPYDAIATSEAWNQYKQYRSRLSRVDQQQFDNFYQQWLNYERLGNREDILRMQGKMQAIMAHYDIPQSVPYAALATTASGKYGGGLVNMWAGRLTLEDQEQFDEDYKNWIEARRADDHKQILAAQVGMEDIMHRYNVPPGVTFEQLASPAVVAPPYSDLKIVKATYGSGAHTVNITNQLQRMVENDKLTVPVNDDTMGTPPGATGKKVLSVSYSIHGKQREVSVPEGGTLKIP